MSSLHTTNHDLTQQLPEYIYIYRTRAAQYILCLASSQYFTLQTTAKSYNMKNELSNKHSLVKITRVIFNQEWYHQHVCLPCAGFWGCVYFLQTHILIMILISGSDNWWIRQKHLRPSVLMVNHKTIRHSLLRICPGALWLARICKYQPSDRAFRNCSSSQWVKLLPVQRCMSGWC